MDTTTTPFDLPPGAALGLSHAAGRELLVYSGRLWLTCRDGGGDLFLTAGDRLRLGPGAVIECDSPGAARLQLLPARSPLRRGGADVLAALGARLQRLPGLRPTPRLRLPRWS